MLTTFKKSILWTVLIWPRWTPGQETVVCFQPIHVTASRLVSSLAAETRALDVLTHEEIAQLPVSSVPELMQFIGGIDIQQRGPGGIQADFSLRGSGFEQVLVLLDGVRLNDPQTGHHNADMPVSLADVDRIEVLHGHASSMYGPDGYGGVINIITRNAENTRTQIACNGGSFGAFGTRISQSLKSSGVSARLNLEHRRSDGYRPVTDYETTALSGTARWHQGPHALRMTTGTVFKDFGANDFYADYPSREKTRAVMAILNYAFHPHDYLDWNLRIHGRRHRDHFILDNERPDWVQNDHTSNTLGAGTQIRFRITPDIQTALGCEWITESLQSGSLGDHRQQRAGVFSELVAPLTQNGLINGGVRLDHHAQWGSFISPSVNLSFRISETVKWRAAAGRIFRAPTFTEQYYQSPANIGNPDLKPEQGWSLETGADARFAGLIFETTLFVRTEKNRIDWIANAPGDPWRVVNIGRLETGGLSLSASPRIPAWQLQYTVMDRNQSETGALSKYQFRLLKHHVNLRTLIRGPWQISQSWNLAWKQRWNDTGYWILSVKATKKVHVFEFFVEGRNLLDSDYVEIFNIPMPGRNFMAGFQVEIGKDLSEEIKTI